MIALRKLVVIDKGCKGWRMIDFGTVLYRFGRWIELTYDEGVYEIVL